jgi:AraC-like DNA-binding protein
MQSEGFYVQFPHLLKVFSQLLFLIFPLLFLQVKYLISDHKKFNLTDLVHFIPWLIVILLNSDFYLSGAEEKLLLNRNDTLYYKILKIIADEIIAIQGVVYSILSLKILSKYGHKIKNYQSNTDKMILKVQYIGISLNFFSWIIGIVGIHLELFNIEINVDLFIFVYLTLVLVIYIISFAALKSPEIFKLDESQIKVVIRKGRQSFDPANDKRTDKTATTKTVSESTVITEDPMIAEINQKLIQYIEIDKPYLNPELSLQELADKLEVKRHSLSSVINQMHNKNFYEFINQYRIEEVKSMLTNPENKHLKFISIAYDSGFNSKASFNRIFKQTTNMTPSQYMESQQ